MSGLKSTKGLFNRRQFILGTGSLLALGGLYQYQRTLVPTVPGQILGANSAMGHRLRSAQFPEVLESRQIPTLIVGGGMAGLSASWWLNRNGYTDFELLELDKTVGGNSSSGESAISPYPWGAHYIPVPGPSATYVQELFKELGLVRDYDEKGQPLYEETFICNDPEDRLYLYGRWQSSLVPQAGLSSKTHEEFKRFFDLTESLKSERGRDGKFFFDIPITLSSQDSKYNDLDKITMDDYLKQSGFTDEYLFWYVNYCCRDDFGLPSKQTSAWMGLHYHCSRRGVGGNVDSDSVLTWPQGNAWVVEKLREKITEKIRPSHMAYQISQKNRQVECLVYDGEKEKSIRYLCSNLILCTPRMISERIVQGLSPDLNIDYGPWMVANISLKEKPKQDKAGAPLSWDNVFYGSESLGYVVATHQELHPMNPKSQWTYYWPLTHLPAKEARQWAYEKDHAFWVNQVIQDLSVPHPNIEELIEKIDVWLWGHAMLQPTPGTIWGETRSKWQESLGSIHFAHSDLSGYSIFEEAQYWGVEAAKKVLGNVHDQ